MILNVRDIFYAFFQWFKSLKVPKMDDHASTNKMIARGILGGKVCHLYLGVFYFIPEIPQPLLPYYLRMIGKQLAESCPRWMALLHEY